jgi:type IV pilus assembly protein PilW
MNEANFFKKRRGFTLVEILVALAIGALLTSGFVQIFSSSKKTYLIQDNLSRLQENARFAMDFLARDIRMAGHIENAVPSSVFGGVAVTGCEDDNCASIGGIPQLIRDKDHLNSGDTIVVSYDATEDGLGQDLTVGRPVTLAGNTTQTISNLAQNAFYVRNGALSCLGNGATSSEPLVEGVENMQILYGEDTTPNDGNYNANLYLPANDPALDMNNVVSVRITLTVATLDDHLALQKNEDAEGNSDNKIRRTFTKTIALRNRIN